MCVVDQVGETDTSWTIMSTAIRKNAKELLGVTSGKRRFDREAWWWNDEIQIKVKVK